MPCSQKKLKAMRKPEARTNECSGASLVLELPALPLPYSEIEYDALTGVYNFACLEKGMQRINQCIKLPLSIIIVDINGLKNVNSTLGYGTGNKLLMEVAAILRNCSTNEGTVYRQGSDGFVILIQNTSSEKAQWICRRILKAYDKYSKQQADSALFPSISLGHATKSVSGQSIESTLAMAEELMSLRKLLERKSKRSALITSLKAAMFEKCPQTADHAARAVTLSRTVGQALQLTDQQMVELELLSLLHDIGKISIDNCILSKPDRLTDEEWLLIKKHPEVGYRIVQASPELKRIAEYILCHHERYDGMGYPYGIGGNSLPLLSRILSVVDAYDAMTEERPYRKAMSQKEALNEIAKNAGTQFDPTIAKLFIECFVTGK